MGAEALLEKGEQLDREARGEPDPQPKQPEPGPAPGPELEQNAGEAQLERNIAGTFAMFGAGVGRFLPSVKLILDESACAELGRELAPVARKYDVASWFGEFKWKEEFRAAMILVPTIIALRQAVEHDLAAARARAGQQEAGADPQPMPGSHGDPSGGGSAAPADVEVLKPIDRAS